MTSGMIRCFTSHGSSKHRDGLAILQQIIERKMLIPLTLRKPSGFSSELREELRSVASRPGGENVQSDCK